MIESDSPGTQLDAKTKFQIFLRLGRLEYLSMPLLFMIPVYLATSEFYWPVFLAVVLSCPVHQLATSYINYYTDQVEDRTNAPERVKICEMVGYQSIKKAAIVSWILSWLWGLLFVFFANPTVVLIYYLGTLLELNYSVGVRFKQHHLLMAISYALDPILIFAGIWAIHEPLHTFPPVAFVLAYEAAVLCCTVKNLPDALGDRRAGRKSFFTAFPTIAGVPPFIAVGIPFFWFSTYVLIALFILLGVLEPKYLISFVTLPMAIYGARWMQRVQDIGDKERLFRYTYFYVMVSRSLLMLIFCPTAPVFVTVVVLAAYSYLVSYLMSREEFSLVQFYTR